MSFPIPTKRIGKGPRRGRILDSAYLAWIRTRPCVVCGIRRWIEAAHVGQRGLSQKCSDHHTLPMCTVHHRTSILSHHQMGKKFWGYWGLNRFQLLQQHNERYAKERA